VKPTPILIAGLAYIVGAAITYLIIRSFSIENVGLVPFIVGALIGTIAGVIPQYRQSGGKLTLRIKTTFGVTFAICAMVVGLVRHQLFTPFTFIEIKVPFAALVSFVIPFVMLDSMWSELSKENAEPESEDT
jgi:hypothetical protein